METEFGKALTAYVAYAQSVIDAQQLARAYTLEAELPRSRVAKFVRITTHASQNSVFGFVRISDGAILYPAGWARPFIAKAGPDAPETIRGSIYDSTTWAACTKWTGVRTIR